MSNMPRVPVIILGGAQNALSVARNLSRSKIPVFAINYPHEAVRFSRSARFIRVDGNDPVSWERFLLSHASDYLQGSILLACSDDAITIVSNNDEALRRKFLLEETSAATRRELLNKHLTYLKAAKFGIPTVRCQLVRSTDMLDAAPLSLSFPFVVKPVYSPESRAIRIKAAVIHTGEQYAAVRKVATQERVDIVRMDYIPGGDDRLCSYFTYLDEAGNPLAHLTKRVRRRYPDNGDGTYHYTEWIPEVAALGLRFFRSLDYRGLGNIEFKWDERDRTFKMIEVNARFAASDCLLAKSGVDLALITYNRLLNRAQSPSLAYRKNLVLWRPIEDFCAARKLYSRGELRPLDWIRQVLAAKLFPFFQWRDPLPACATLFYRFLRALQSRSGHRVERTFEKQVA